MSSWMLYITFIFIVTFAVGEIRNKGWWKNMIFYQVYPRSFMDSNGDGDGDLKGITSKLEHFVDLGVKAIWMSPINTSPMIDGGYDILNFRDIDKMFGTVEDFQELIKEANELGIKVIMDFVPNHTSDKHEWFDKSVNSIGKYKDYYIWRRGKANNTEPPNNWLSLFDGSAWKYNEKRDLWYFHQFDYRQPDLNYTNPDVQQEMNDILIYWLEKGVNGFRVDAVNALYEDDQFRDEPLSHLPGVTKEQFSYLNHLYTGHDSRDYNIIRKWKNVIDEWVDLHNEEERLIVTEVYSTLSLTIKYYKYGVHIPFNFNLDMYLNNTSQPSDFKTVIDEWMAAMPKNAIANWVTSNHDHQRTTTTYPERPDLLPTLAMILPGIACIYYGEEITMTDNFDITWEQTQDPHACALTPNTYLTISRDPCRTPFQWDDTKNAGFSNATITWLPVNKNYNYKNLFQQKREPESHYKYFQKLSKLKNTSKIILNGSLKVDVLNKNKVLAVIRQISNKVIILLINFSNNILQKVNVSTYLPKIINATIIVSSVGSGIKWGTSISVTDVKLPPKVSLILTNDIYTFN